MKKYFVLSVLGLLAAGQSFAQTGFTKTPKGALYNIVKPGNGAKVKVGDVITFQFTQKNDRDSLLGSSYKMGQPAKVQVQPSKSVADLMEVFSLLSVNDSVLVRVPTDSIFAGHEESRPAFLPKSSYLNFGIKIQKIQTMDEAMAERTAAMEKQRTEQAALAEKMRTAEVPSITAFIADKKLTPVTTASGLKYIVTAPGTGRKPKPFDTVMVNYVGHTLDGKVFDSSIAEVAQSAGLQQPGRNYEPIKFVVGGGQVIPGWDEGLLLLNEGSKATFIIPSKLAYGERGAGDDIKPYSPLWFDVELVKVIAGKGKPVTPAVAAGKKAAPKKAGAKKPAVKKKVTRK
ncbi:FKBP-type peptidyl-prolyl cis-trans isomerase [Mucilaginibacter sp. CSA2-8R]|uniref:FKBP-type peptidyl-prolyl cis-trans isomerase n=1 Tax=Mucilaginibacter sp. CSA2-8R TaxID=3141542 RepID=UPI00315D9A2C